MDQEYFWQNWKKPYRTFYLILLAGFLASMVLMTVTIVMGPDASIKWDVSESIEPLATVADRFEVGLFPVEVRADNLLITRSFNGTELVLHPVLSVALLGMTALFLVFYFSIVSSLRRFWYFIFLTTGVALLLSLKFEQLQLFGTVNNTGFIIALAAYLPLSYYFQTFRPDTSFITRLVVVFPTRRVRFCGP